VAVAVVVAHWSTDAFLKVRGFTVLGDFDTKTAAQLVRRETNLFLVLERQVAVHAASFAAGKPCRAAGATPAILTFDVWFSSVGIA